MQARKAAKKLELKRIGIIEAIDGHHLPLFRRRQTRLAGSPAIVGAEEAHIHPHPLIHGLRAN
ncbi:hypothetical protein BCh11DRAFT_01514 [Burkholderia sp. Ch1-1]|uniref:Uncharacterized protein n=1 Tax=Paraburkholderia dioscoreae TaxID=2604047 RepID=A0A5Q4YXM1_9BURK|nr:MULTISPECIES: hypothetical protein [Paraburkholderia]EIF33732.1 hypothetical protein BCh11DRAFT_01514 [Burkholderia sp. Ch1-1]MDR8399733.1 hypothetical protein [Paraburkholderia sp. USG1]VVD32612.1 conserved protein of unknown function [Paraburkholderia dioscoreae]